MQYCLMTPNTDVHVHTHNPDSNSDDSILHLEFLEYIDDEDEDGFEGSALVEMIVEEDDRHSKRLRRN
eukprot:CAMPEP_0194393500 /NCGR_PEP_ID=MMETSP0174-20130528/123332_1 /TAXON_ID=216777 /ORGANISM="Proboscia alata, Strain PI-D3" /LENGTH=67 /DNA_ID=CAMNT_0039189191 /DNA_START=859 /DNA_END=1062 /DNA_ORIENTATION=+